jgi:hypothetical protein
LYELTTKAQKDRLVQEVVTLKQSNAELLALNEQLQTTQNDQAAILDILTYNGHVDEVIRRLQLGDEYHSIAAWLQRQPELHDIGHRRTETTVNQLYRVVELIESRFRLASPRDGGAGPVLAWTVVTRNQPLISHLFELYFTWVHPVHMLFSENAFLDCYHTGDATFCSTPLVNAICAMACHLLDVPAPGVSATDIKQSMKLRDAFMHQARSTLDISSLRLSMPSLQALIVMFLVELSAGRARSATGYLRCAADNLSTPGSADEDWTREDEITQWGIHTLNT